MNESLILVNKQDEEVGEAGKEESHRKGLLHRAFSVLVFREASGKQELLLQRRQKDKYHSGRLWSNTCCGHPRPGENLLHAATRRLREEMGFCVPLTYVDFFYYYHLFASNLAEHEIDHVFVGFSNEIRKIAFNPDEVSEIAWVSLDFLIKDYALHPKKYTVWLPKTVELAKIIISTTLQHD